MAPNLTALEAQIKADTQASKGWLVAHERLIITVLVILSFVFLGNKFLSHQAEKDNAAATAAAITVSQQQEINKTLQVQVTQNQQALTALVAQLTSQNAQLANSTAQRTVVLQQQVAQDKQLPLPQLGNRWNELASLAPGDLTATTAGVTVTPQGAVATVLQLEQVPVLTKNLADSQQQTANTQQLLDATTDSNKLLTTQVTGLNLTITDKDKACTTEITALKATARKSKLKTFFYGVGTGAGIVAALIIHAAV